MRSIGLYIADLCLILAGTLAALALRNDFVLPIDRLAAFAPYAAATMVSAAVVVVALGLHRSIWGLASFRDFERIALAGVLTVLGASMIGFAVDRLVSIPRSLPMLQMILVVTFMLAARGLTRRFRRQRQAKGAALGAVRGTFGQTRSTVLIVGVNAITELYLKGIEEVADNEIEVVGILGRSSQQVGRFIQSARVLGLPEDIHSVLRDLEIGGIVVDRIAVTVPLNKLSAEARAALSEIEESMPISLHLLADQFGLGIPEDAAVADETEQAGSGLVFTRNELALIEGRSWWAAKRVLDIVGSATLIVLAAPLILLVALVVLVDVGAPVMFCQRRPGRNGRPFRLYKFRSMMAAYDRKGHRIDDALRSSWIGQLLRRTRLDELPQLYNVLIGDMSFVGPRPLLPVDQPPEFQARLLVRPGITGWAQIKGGRVVGPADKTALDVWYVQNSSLALDLAVVLGTVPMVLRGERVDHAAIAQAWRDLEPTGVTENWKQGDGAAADEEAGYDAASSDAPAAADKVARKVA